MAVGAAEIWYNIRQAMVLRKGRIESPYEVFGCIPHGARAYRERDSFTMGADSIVFV